MSATIVKAATLAAALFGLTTAGATAQDAATGKGAGADKSERGMSDKAGSTEGKSERAMPGQTKETGMAPASSERAMPASEKK